MQKKNKILATVLILPFCYFLHAQNWKADWKKLEQIKADTHKVEWLLHMNHQYYSTDDSITAGYPLLLEAYKIAKEQNSYRHIADVAYELGDFFNYFKDHIKATDFFIISLRNAEKAKYERGEARAQMGLGINFYVQKKWEDANKKFAASIQIYQRIHALSECQTPVYLSGLVQLELHHFAEAQKLLNEALITAKQTKNEAREHECKIGLARVLAGLKQYDTAKAILYAELPFYQQSNETVGVILIHYYLGSIYFETGNLNNALQEAEVAMKMADNTNMISNSLEITLLLSKIYEKLGNPQQAYFYLNKNQAIRDSLYNRDVSAQIIISNANYEFEKRENTFKEQLEQNKRHRQNLLFIAALCAVIAIGAVLAFFFIRKERKKSENLLLNILPGEIANELKSRGKVIPKNHESISVMFCDAVNFTTICEKLNADIIVNLLDIYFSEFDKIVAKYDLEKIKTIGDCYMCAGGLVDNAQNYAIQCIQAAKDFLHFCDKIEEDMVSKFGVAFQFRIGIHTGNVVSGIVGSKKYAYDIWGDTVNIAARIEQNSEVNQINISGDTLLKTGSAFTVNYRGKIKAKNKQEMDMYFVERK